MSASEPGIKWRRDGDPQRIEEREVGLGMSAYMHVRYINGERTAVTAIGPAGILPYLSVREIVTCIGVQHEHINLQLVAMDDDVLGVTVIWQ